VRAAVVVVDGERVGPLGGLPVTEITTDVVQAWVTRMGTRRYRHRGEMQPYSPKTIHNIHGGVLSPALSWAARKGHIDASPCTGVQLPQMSKRSVTIDQVPTGREIGRWIALAYEVSQLAGDITSLAFGTGLRWGEITALRPIDIDLRRGLLTVAQAVKEDGATRRPYVASYGKSDAALRTIRIPDSVVLVLRRRMKGCAERELLFRGTRGGILNSSGWHQTHWSKVVARAAAAEIDTEATIHKMRHGHATALLAENVSLDTVSKRLGHASIAVTANLYSHLTPEADRRAADVIGQVMNR
jgi:integrase